MNTPENNERNASKAMLYFITDSSVTGRERLVEIAEEGIAAGIDMIQVREKRLADGELYRLTQDIVRAAQSTKCRVLVNDPDPPCQ